MAARSYIEFQGTITRRFRVLRQGWQSVHQRARQVMVAADGTIDITESATAVQRWRMVLSVAHEEAGGVYGTLQELREFYTSPLALTATLPDEAQPRAVVFEGPLAAMPITPVLDGPLARFAVPIQLVQGA